MNLITLSTIMVTIFTFLNVKLMKCKHYIHNYQLWKLNELVCIIIFEYLFTWCDWLICNHLHFSYILSVCISSWKCFYVFCSFTWIIKSFKMMRVQNQSFENASYYHSLYKYNSLSKIGKLSIFFCFKSCAKLGFDDWFAIPPPVSLTYIVNCKQINDGKYWRYLRW